MHRDKSRPLVCAGAQCRGAVCAFSAISPSARCTPVCHVRQRAMCAGARYAPVRGVLVLCLSVRGVSARCRRASAHGVGARCRCTKSHGMRHQRNKRQRTVYAGARCSSTCSMRWGRVCWTRWVLALIALTRSVLSAEKK